MDAKELKRGILEKGSALFCLAAGWALLFLSFLIGFEVIARKFFEFSTQGADEIGGYVLATSSAIAFSFGLYRKSHIRIDVLLRHLPHRWRAVFNVVAFATLNFFAWTLAWHAIQVAIQSVELSALAPTPLATPLIIPQGIWSSALLLFAIVCAVQLVTAVKWLVLGRWSDVAVHFGPSDVKEELDEEIASAKRRLDEGVAGTMSPGSMT